MKQIFVIVAFFMSLSVSAQYTSFTPEAPKKETQQPSADDEKDTPADSIVQPVVQIDPKYGVGSCPEVDGKVVWSQTFECKGLTAQQIYDKMIPFLVDYCKQEGKDPVSRIAIVNKETHEIGARISEFVVFKDKGIVLDRALFNYTLRINCYDGKCEAIMQNLSYNYEDRKFPAEEMLSDRNALNKSRTKFNRGGYEKFRTKTIDTKDALMAQIGACLE